MSVGSYSGRPIERSQSRMRIREGGIEGGAGGGTGKGAGYGAPQGEAEGPPGAPYGAGALYALAASADAPPHVCGPAVAPPHVLPKGAGGAGGAAGGGGGGGAPPARAGVSGTEAVATATGWPRASTPIVTLGAKAGCCYGCCCCCCCYCGCVA
jgi:hypothetical protein